MRIIFEYSPEKEFDNFKNTSTSINHPEPSAVFKLYLEKYQEFTQGNVISFTQWYLAEKNIDIEKIRNEIEKNWQKISEQFFARASQIFKNKLPLREVTAYLTIDNRCSYSLEKNYFFIHLYPDLTNKTIMHELLHFYFWHTGGREIKEKFGYKIFNDIKESLTVLLNIEFQDLMGGIQDKGYPQHQNLRQLIENSYKKDKDVNKIVQDCLGFLAKA